jgi:N-methylhydantoinase B
VLVKRHDGSEERWRKISNLPLQKGETVSFQGGGGGGYGSPFERDPEKVRLDVIDGYVSLERAKQDYGIVIEKTTLKIDTQATEELRARMKKEDRQDEYAG